MSEKKPNLIFEACFLSEAMLAVGKEFAAVEEELGIGNGRAEAHSFLARKNQIVRARRAATRLARKLGDVEWRLERCIEGFPDGDS